MAITDLISPLPLHIIACRQAHCHNSHSSIAWLGCRKLVAGMSISVVAIMCCSPSCQVVINLYSGVHSGWVYLINKCGYLFSLPINWVRNRFLFQKHRAGDKGKFQASIKWKCLILHCTRCIESQLHVDKCLDLLCHS